MDYLCSFLYLQWLQSETLLGKSGTLGIIKTTSYPVGLLPHPNRLWPAWAPRDIDWPTLASVGELLCRLLPSHILAENLVPQKVGLRFPQRALWQKLYQTSIIRSNTNLCTSQLITPAPWKKQKQLFLRGHQPPASTIPLPRLDISPTSAVSHSTAV